VDQEAANKLVSHERLNFRIAQARSVLIDVSEHGFRAEVHIAHSIRSTPVGDDDLPCDVPQRQLRSTSESQFPSRRPHGFQRRDTDRWVEPSEQRADLGASYQTGPKAIPEEVKLNVGILAFAFPVFAVDDLGFRRMHFQVAFTIIQADTALRWHRDGCPSKVRLRTIAR
jgi:hypothetical protein